MNLKPILHTLLDDYALPLSGDHGVAHWARVLGNGLRLAAETGANVEVVSLFAVLHDSRRINEVTDPEHGPRAAEFATELRGTVFDLDDHGLRLLYRACEGHTHERNHPDVTIQICWDSDRLDLGRVGIMPHRSRLCTEVAKRPETIKWADGRASFGVIPKFVLDEWGIDLGKGKDASTKALYVRKIHGVQELTPRHNIAPSQSIAAVRVDPDARQREFVRLQWGLIPPSAKDRKIGYSTINARAETVDSKPSIRSSFKKRRCLVIADGFYEWQKSDAKKKQPFHIHM